MSRSRKSSGGTGAKIIWFFVIAGLVIAFFQVPYSPGAKGVQEIVESKAKTVEQWVGGVAPGLQKIVTDIIKGGGQPEPITGGSGGTGGSSNPNPGNLPPAGDSDSRLGTLQQAEPANAGSYDRNTWNHWVDVRSCWTVREEVLAAEAKSVKMKDANGQETTDRGRACEIVSGEWVDAYSGKTFTNPGDLDIDHMVPLSYAHKQGGHAWDNGRKQSYANDLTSPNTLIAVSASENRSKGDKGPASWKPSNKGSWCGYASSWIEVSSKWSLSVTPSDATALREMLATC